MILYQNSSLVAFFYFSYDLICISVKYMYKYVQSGAADCQIDPNSIQRKIFITRN